MLYSFAASHFAKADDVNGFDEHSYHAKLPTLTLV